MKKEIVPNTEVMINELSPYSGMRGIVLKADPRSDLIWVDVNGLSYPLWCMREHLDVIGRANHSNGFINQHLYSDMFDPHR